MTMKRKMSASPSDRQVPARQIAALKRQVRKLKAERDQYLQTIHAWAKEKIVEYKLDTLCPLLISWVHPLNPEQQDKSLKKVPAGQTPISRLELAEQIIADALPVRFQIQLHKVIWAPEKRGV